jgi:hypothetical protein
VFPSEDLRTLDTFASHSTISVRQSVKTSSFWSSGSKASTTRHDAVVTASSALAPSSVPTLNLKFDELQFLLFLFLFLCWTFVGRAASPAGGVVWAVWGETSSAGTVVALALGRVGPFVNSSFWSVGLLLLRLILVVGC